MNKTNPMSSDTTSRDLPQRAKIAFFGTDPLAADILRELEAAHLTPSLIVASPDKSLSRGKKILFPPEKQWALEHNIPVLQPDKLDAAFIAHLKAQPWDAFVVASYGKIISRTILTIPKKGVINVHPSLLPRLRGPSPIRSAILTDDRDIGVSIMLLDEKMDHGPLLAQERVTPPQWPLRGRELDAILARAGAELLARTLPRWLSGTITPREQDHAQATYCAMFTKDMGKIDLADDPAENLRKIFAFDGWPGAFTFFTHADRPVRVVIEDAHIRGGMLVLDRIKPEGKQSMPFADFARGLK